MNWQEKALTLLVEGLVEKYVEGTDAYNRLSDIGIEIQNDLAGSTVDMPYQLLQEVSNWDVLAENLNSFHCGNTSKEQIVKWILEYIQENMEGKK